jgi:DnaJ like chaperone protein
MNFYGKIVGAIIGLAIFRWPGMFLGLIVGHLFDVYYAKDFAKQGGFAKFFTNTVSIQRQAIFFHALFSALGHICKADGKVTEDEIAVASKLMDNMRLRGDTRSEAQQAFRDGKAKNFPLEQMLNDFKRHSHGRRDILQVFLEILISAACADGRITPPELGVLEKVALTLGFSTKDLHFLISTYEAEQRFRSHSAHSKNAQGENGRSEHKRGEQRQQAYQQYSSSHSLQDAYHILGINAQDDNKTIKRAYKKQMSLHHPDKLSAKGLPEQALEMAKVKAQDIQAAYELIKQKRGL